VHAFYRKALESGVKVFFVTARSEAEPGNRESTLRQLRDCGYDKFEALLMAPRYTQHFKGIKKAHREAITKKGYDVLVNAGDQWADLVEGCVSPALEAALTKECLKRPLVFYNGKENSCLCIKLWS
jgi:predicted secreted acid phosphatase